MQGGEFKNKRKRLYYKLKQLDSASKDPELLQDPLLKAEKKKKDDTKRILKKLSKKSSEMTDFSKLSSTKCLFCMGRGHLMSECRQMKENKEIPVDSLNICYKCGSLDHSLKDCKVSGKNFSKLLVSFVEKRSYF